MSSRSKVVSTRTRGLVSSTTMRRVASIPSTPGIRTSISTTSGWSSAASVAASAPSPASPTTSIPGSPREDQAEARADERLVVGEQDPDHASSSVRQPRVDREPALAARPGVDLAADDATRSLIPSRPLPVPGAVRPPRPSSTTVDLDRVGREAHVDARDRRPGMLEHVRQRLLDDPVAADVDSGRDAVRDALDWSSTGSPDARISSASAGSRSSDGLRRPRLLLVVVPQHPEQPAHLAERLLARALDRVERRARRLGIGTEHLAPATRLDDDDRDRVRDDVVELASDPRALLRDGDSRPLVLVALELDRAEGERALTVPSEPDRQPGSPGATDDQRGEDDVAPVKGVAVVGYERGDRERNQHGGAPTPDALARSLRASRARRRRRPRRSRTDRRNPAPG